MSVADGNWMDEIPPNPGDPTFEEMLAYGDELAEREEREERLANAKKKIPTPDKDAKGRPWVVNHIEFDKETWDWIWAEANVRGIGTEQFVSDGMRELKTIWIDNLDEIKDPERYIHRAERRSAAIVRAHENAYAIAVNYKNYPTEENTKILHTTCEILGLDPEELLERVRDDRFAEFVSRYRNDKDSKMNRCIRWVMNFCQEKDEILSEDFNFAGEDAGYTKQMLSTARRKVGIDSVLRGGKYFLVMPIGRKVLFGRVKEE